ncbi:DUF6234 family protein [Kitasatospora sp. NPDC094028]
MSRPDQHPAPASVFRRLRQLRRPKPSRAADIALGVTLLIVLAVVYLGGMFNYGMIQWGAASDSGSADRTLEHEQAFVRGLLAAAVAVAALAALLRARWTAGLQLFAAAALFAIAVQLGHTYDSNHPAPPPPPNPAYVPCYSGSGRCD